MELPDFLKLPTPTADDWNVVGHIFIDELNVVNDWFAIPHCASLHSLCLANRCFLMRGDNMGNSNKENNVNNVVDADNTDNVSDVGKVDAGDPGILVKPHDQSHLANESEDKRFYINQIVVLRALKGITLAEIAKKLNTTVQQVCEFETDCDNDLNFMDVVAYLRAIGYRISVCCKEHS